VLSELAFAAGATRTFMFAALAARKDPAAELDFAVSLINGVVGDASGTRVRVHACRGNWSRDERRLLSRNTIRSPRTSSGFSCSS
jgi:5-methyltetrahydropteroyltriglutamate--homocysteine methyltransferase